MISCTENLLTINPYSRSGKKLVGVQALVIHWTGSPGQGVSGVQAYFEGRKAGKDGYGGAHYTIGLGGEIVRMIPETEVAYHCGTSQIDPVSQKMYTDLARSKFGKYAVDFKNLSPNMVTLGVEHCIIDAHGTMNSATYSSSVLFSADICRRYKLNPLTDIVLHKEVVGWKDCHKWFIDHPDLWVQYKKDVANKI